MKILKKTKHNRGTFHNLVISGLSVHQTKGSFIMVFRNDDKILYENPLSNKKLIIENS